ncbi:hypothetical protein BpHYR1_006976, partial [Brachionus plicatilis]
MIFNLKKNLKKIVIITKFPCSIVQPLKPKQILGSTNKYHLVHTQDLKHIFRGCSVKDFPYNQDHLSFKEPGIGMELLFCAIQFL